RSQSGRRSDVSERVMVTVESVVDQATVDELNDKLANMPSITWSAAEPTAADGEGKPVGAVWRQVTGGEITGEWAWDGAAWNARQIASDAIAALEVGKLVAGSAAVDEVVAQEIWAAKIAAQEVQASEIATETLAADTGFIGVLNSATIVGAIIKTAETGQRVELDSGHGIQVFNAAGEEVLSADADGNLVLGGDITLGGTLTTGGRSNKVTVRSEGIVLTSNDTYLKNKISTWGNVHSLGFGNDTIYAVESWRGNYRVRPYDATGDPSEAWDIPFLPDAVTADDNRVYVLEYNSSFGSSIGIYDHNLNYKDVLEIPNVRWRSISNFAGDLYVCSDTKIWALEMPLKQ